MATIQERALLNTIRMAEGTWLGGDPSGYQVMFGGGKTPSLSRHPDTVVSSGGYRSAAAGAYQFMPGTWAPLQQRLGLKDFGPEAQDAAALALVGQRGARDLINREGFTPDVAAKLSPEWASFPTKQGKSYYGQPVKSYADLKQFYDSQIETLSKGGNTPAAATPALPRPSTGDTFTNALLKSMGLGGGAPSPVAATRPEREDLFSLGGADGLRLLPVPSRGKSAAPELIGGGGMFDYLSRALGGGAPREAMSNGAPLAGGGMFAGLMKAILNPSNQGSGMSLPSTSQVLPSAQGLATGGGRMKVGKVAHPSQDVFPTTGAHLDVRIMKDGEYINPESARSILRHLKVGGQPLYSQQGAEWKPSHQVTSGFGPRVAPTAGASSYHRGVDYAVGHGVPLEWTGGGTFTRGHGHGRIDIPGYTIKLLHTVPD